MKTIFSSILLMIATTQLNAATFVVVPNPGQLPVAKYVESYAFSTASETMITEIRARIASGQQVSPVVRIATGGDTINRNYLAPGAPEWNWHVTEVIELDCSWVEIQVYPYHNPKRDTSLHDISSIGLDRFISTTGDQISPRFLVRIYEVAPDDIGRVVNVSTRGVLGAGSKVLIAGFIVQGTTPRLVFVRAMGPSLTAYGVDGAASDPMARLYRGPTQIGFNDDWRSGQNTDIIPAGFAPGNDKESAIVAILEPGLYSVHAISADQGVGLIEVFDLSGIK
jgi:hypothetical protein